MVLLFDFLNNVCFVQAFEHKSPPASNIACIRRPWVVPRPAPPPSAVSCTCHSWQRKYARVCIFMSIGIQWLRWHRYLSQSDSCAESGGRLQPHTLSAPCSAPPNVHCGVLQSKSIDHNCLSAFGCTVMHHGTCNAVYCGSVCFARCYCNAQNAKYPVYIG